MLMQAARGLYARRLYLLELNRSIPHKALRILLYMLQKACNGKNNERIGDYNTTRTTATTITNNPYYGRPAPREESTRR
uniref:(California timema) hypothetical protein n=1 Tax=Timema californicum TaxID=61474 RepID=A0A7R9PFV5_TIMCA|nr:unnamed protein product [Timema californicum]